MGEPISINTYKTRAQMDMEFRQSNFKTVPSSQTQPNITKNNFKDNLSRYPRILFGSVAQPKPDSYTNEGRTEFFGRNPANPVRAPVTRSPIESELITLASKVQEIRKLLLRNFQPNIVDNFIRNLSVAVIFDRSRESIVDETLGKLRNNSNTVTEIFSHFLNLNYSNFNAKTTNKVALMHNHYNVEQLSDEAITKLHEIELILKLNTHPSRIWDIIEDLIKRVIMTGDYSILDNAIVYYGTRGQKHGIRGSY
jgi:hypothetical protein